MSKALTSPTSDISDRCRRCQHLWRWHHDGKEPAGCTRCACRVTKAPTSPTSNISDLPRKAFAAQTDRAAYEELRLEYDLRHGRVLSDKTFAQVLRADLQGVPYVPPKTSARATVLKAVAFVVLFPFMFISPGLTTRVLERIDEKY